MEENQMIPRMGQVHYLTPTQSRGSISKGVRGGERQRERERFTDLLTSIRDETIRGLEVKDKYFKGWAETQTTEVN